MLLQPSSLDELARLLAEASRRNMPVAGADLRQMSALLEHQPEDMTATGQAGMTLQALQETLRPAGQCLPIDPPESDALTLADLLAFDISGPRRVGYGTIRDYVIGLKA